MLTGMSEMESVRAEVRRAIELSAIAWPNLQHALETWESQGENAAEAGARALRMLEGLTGTLTGLCRTLTAAIVGDAIVGQRASFAPEQPEPSFDDATPTRLSSATRGDVALYVTAWTILGIYAAATSLGDGDRDEVSDVLARWAIPHMSHRLVPVILAEAPKLLTNATTLIETQAWTDGAGALLERLCPGEHLEAARVAAATLVEDRLADDSRAWAVILDESPLVGIHASAAVVGWLYHQPAVAGGADAAVELAQRAAQLGPFAL